MDLTHAARDIMQLLPRLGSSVARLAIDTIYGQM